MNEQKKIDLDHILRIPQVCQILGMSRSSVYREVQAGRLPKPVKVLPGSTRKNSPSGIFASEVAAYQEAQRQSQA